MNETTTENGGSVLAMRAGEAAKMLGVSERAVWGLVRSGRLQIARLGRRVLFPRAVLLEWLESATGYEAKK